MGFAEAITLKRVGVFGGMVLARTVWVSVGRGFADRGKAPSVHDQIMQKGAELDRGFSELEARMKAGPQVEEDYELADIMAAIRNVLPESKEEEINALALEFEAVLGSQGLGAREFILEILSDLLRVCQDVDRARSTQNIEELKQVLLHAKHDLSQRLAVMSPDIRGCGMLLLQKFFALLLP